MSLRVVLYLPSGLARLCSGEGSGYDLGYPCSQLSELYLLNTHPG